MGHRTGKREPPSAITPLPCLAMPAMFPCGGPDFRLAGAHQAIYPNAPPSGAGQSSPPTQSSRPTSSSTLRERDVARHRRQVREAGATVRIRLQCGGSSGRNAATGDSSRTDHLERQDDRRKSKKPVASRRQKVLKTVPIAFHATRSSCARQGLMICCRFKENE
jgi:hypothetical protein